MSGTVVCEQGTLFPINAESENTWPQGLRAILYAIGLGWCFLGVAIVSDVFMSAIEKITSKKTRKYNPVTKRWTTHFVWNPTIANLSLMALGSSAPEILLSVIEILAGGMFAGDLGPSTIVGSAAFNLLMIIAVCVSAIPAGEVRYIKEVPVYVITAFFSIWAYVWLIIILRVSSKNVITPAEGVITFLYFPVLLILSYLADVGYFSKKKERSSQSGRASLVSSDMTKEELAELEAKIRREHGAQINEEQLAKLLKIEAMNRPTRAHYRVGAIRQLVGGRRVKTNQIERSGTMAKLGNSLFRSASGFLSPKHKGGAKVMPALDGSTSAKEKAKVCMQFSAPTFAVLENAGGVKLTVNRSGDTSATAKVSYRTREGTAKKGSDFVHVEGSLTFQSGELSQTITITIVDDNAYEEDEEFYVDLLSPKLVIEGEEKQENANCEAVLGDAATVTVVIIDDDLPGVISFPDDTLKVQEGMHDLDVEIAVQRRNGGTGTITCKYESEDGTAVAEDDYSPLKGTLTFEPGVTYASIPCTIKARGRYDRVESFTVTLTNPTGGAKFDADTDGGAECCILTVQIQSNQMAKDRIDRIMSSMQQNWSRAKLGTGNWRDQFVQAIYVNGGEDEEDEDGGGQAPSIGDYIMHGITLPWKLFFALVPPTDYCDGWVCFCSSLGMIGAVTAVIGDLAGLLGCALEIPAQITAITFVALGTSMPDTFASKTAALQDPHADASVGNVTGSNSVNVFLGLGLPWMMGSIYWSNKRPTADWRRKAVEAGVPSEFLDQATASFFVKAGSLVPAVIIFSCCAITCITILAIRRHFCGGELGGPKIWATVTSFCLVSLWIIYVSLASYYALKNA